MKTIANASNNSVTSSSGSVVATANSSTAPTANSENVNNDETTTGTAQPFHAPVTTAVVTTAAAGITLGSKRPASLDLNKCVLTTKKRLVTPSPLVFDSSDLQNNKTVNTPDIEKFLLSNNLLQTPQPGVVFPTKVGPVTSEQEAFGKGFEDALHILHTSKNSQAQQNSNSNSNTGNTASAPNAASINAATTGTVMSGGSFTYTNLENFPIAIKDEPQHSTSPPVSPIDMETQEKIKLERKRQRNRVAASKCRKRKLERISKLEDNVKVLKTENADLGLVVKNLKDHVAQLKQKVIEHIGSGCSIPNIYNSTTLLQDK